MAALLTIEVAEHRRSSPCTSGSAARCGVTVLPPDINSSELAFTVDARRGVRFGLGAVKNVGESAVLALLDVRRREGRVRSLYRLCEQLDSRQVNRRVFESLVKAGALDSLAVESPALSALPAASLRARLFAAVEKALDHGNRTRRDRDQGQAQLFGGFDQPAGAPVPIEMELSEAPPWTEAQQLSGEKESLGLYWSGHPVERYADELRAIGARTIAELLADSEAPDDAADDAPPAVAPRAFETCVGGVIVAVRPLKTRKGARMAAFTLDDPQGSIEVIAFPDAFEKAAALIQTDSMVLVKGLFDREDDKAKLKANEIVPLDAVREKAARAVAVRLVMPPHDRATVEAVLAVLSRHRGDRRVCLELELRGTPEPMRVKADLLGPMRVTPSAQLVADLEKVCGQGTVVLR